MRTRISPATSEAGADRIVTVLAVSPNERDHHALRQIFSKSNWQLYEARTLRSAVALVQQKPIPVMICEADLPDGNWRDALSLLNRSADPPLLIVTSRDADERLWAEVLNLGGYDVLPQPFDLPEVIRILGLAWRHWKESNHSGTVAASPAPLSFAVAG